jgi:hypothetical protein
VEPTVGPSPSEVDTCHVRCAILTSPHVVSAQTEPPIDPQCRLGRFLGKGEFGQVYVDRYDPSRVIKRHDMNRETKWLVIRHVAREVEAFCTYYGQDAAGMMATNDSCYAY